MRKYKLHLLSPDFQFIVEFMAFEDEARDVAEHIAAKYEMDILYLTDGGCE